MESLSQLSQGLKTLAAKSRFCGMLVCSQLSVEDGVSGQALVSSRVLLSTVSSSEKLGPQAWHRAKTMVIQPCHRPMGSAGFAQPDDTGFKHAMELR